MLIGAYWHDTNNETDIGIAYVFICSRTAWTEQAKLTAIDGAADDQFGYSVAMNGDNILIGAPKAYKSDDSCDSAYVYTLFRKF